MERIRKNKKLEINKNTHNFKIYLVIYQKIYLPKQSIFLFKLPKCHFLFKRHCWPNKCILWVQQGHPIFMICFVAVVATVSIVVYEYFMLMLLLLWHHADLLIKHSYVLQLLSTQSCNCSYSEDVFVVVEVKCDDLSLLWGPTTG